MALGSTMFTFDLAISDVDRGVYDTVQVRVAQHPSETTEYLVARVLAFALEHAEGIAFTAGLASAEEPALEVRDLTGVRHTWIDIGTPEPARLHRASKAVDRVAVYCHKDPEPWLRRLAAASLYAPERIHLYALDPAMVALLAATVGRRCSWSVSRSEGELYVDADAESVSSTLAELQPGTFG